MGIDKAMVIVPHADDAEFMVSGTVALWTQDGTEVTYVIVTNGDKGSDDPYWPGTEAVAQYQGNGGTATNAVPVANTGGAGTRDAHWREAHMGRELMTGFINTGENPLS